MTKHKPQMDLKRPISWSAISSFEYDPEQWYRKYVLNQPDPPNAEMLFGSMIDKRVQAEPDFLPDLHRFSAQQHELNGIFGKIPLIGFPDQWAHLTKDALSDTKTGVKVWDQKRADETGQLSMYLFMLYLLEGVNPEDVRLWIDWIPTKRTENGDFKVKIDFVKPVKVISFETRRTKLDVINFGAKIKRIHQEMQDYAKHHG